MSPDRPTERPAQGTAAAAKAALRGRLLAARAAMPAAERATAGDRLAAVALAAEPIADARCVTAYVGVGTEPATGPLLGALLDAGVVVLLPVISAARQLRWAPYEGPRRLAPGPLGLLEPTADPLPSAAATAADVLLVPALAVDRRGYRLGRGGGYYDRLLAVVCDAPAWAVVYDAEVLDDVPVEPHDVAVHGALTPRGVLDLSR